MGDRARTVFGDVRFAFAYLALAPIYLAPLVVTRFLPAFDLPHQLAIVDALLKGDATDSAYARHFSVGLELAPFSVHFVLLKALGSFVTLGVAAKLLIGAVVLALPLTVARLLVGSGKSPLPALLAFPLVYSMPLHYGLVAFVVALPLVVWLLAEASDETGWRERPRRTALRLALLALATFFAHLEAWAVGMVGASWAVLASAPSRRTRALGLGALAPSLAPAALYLARIAREPRFAHEPSLLRALYTARSQELAEHGVLSDLASRIRGVPVHLLRGFNDGSDETIASAWLAVVALWMLLGIASGGVRSLRTRPRAGPLGLVLVGALAYLGFPHHALPHAYSVYPRFALVLALLLLLVVPARVANWSARARTACTGLVSLLLVAQGLWWTRQYAAFGRELDDFERVVDSAPPGKAAGGLVFDAESRVMNIGGLFTGVPAYYVTERPAARSSTWLYYCAWPQLPCRMRNPEAAPLPFFSHPQSFDARRALLDLDLLFVRGGPPEEVLFGGERARVHLLAERGAWRLFGRR
ncbi:MAG: hypothetical protein U0263_30685 [Polyangiaceae bacterium]